MTTASTAQALPFRHNRLLHRLCIVFLIVWTVSAFHPIMVADWWLENLMVFGCIGLLVATHRLFPLSDLSYVLICVYLCMHEWGAHHRYANVPIGEWVRTIFHTTRNDYDRVVHFAYGLLLTYPQREWFMRKANLRGSGNLWVPVIFSLGLGAGYEILEAVVAVLASPDAGEAFLGLQGDPWDTHKDMFMGFAGSVVSMSLTAAMVRIRVRRQRAREPERLMAVGR